jgi:hypothetical protein
VHGVQPAALGIKFAVSDVVKFLPTAKETNNSQSIMGNKIINNYF